MMSEKMDFKVEKVRAHRVFISLQPMTDNPAVWSFQSTVAIHHTDNTNCRYNTSFSQARRSRRDTACCILGNVGSGVLAL